MTQDASKPHNIFEAASRLEKERREKTVKKQAPSKTVEPVQDDSLSSIFKRCHQMHKEIADSLDLALKRGGISPSQLRSYVSRPQNFSATEWQRIESQRSKNEKLLKELKNKIGARGAEIEAVASSLASQKEAVLHPAIEERPPLTEAPEEEEPPIPEQGRPVETPVEKPPKPLPPGGEEEGPAAPTPPSPEKPPPKKPKIVTRRHWIGM
jgi:hypothetical protein